MARPRILDAFQVQYDMMTAAGIWPKDNPTVSYKLRTLTTWVLSVGLTICMMIESIAAINDFTRLSKTLYIMIIWIAYLIKLAGFVYNRKYFLELMNFLNDPIFISFSEDLDQRMWKSIKISIIFTKILRNLYMSCVVLYGLHPILDNVPLPFPFPYDFGNYRYLMFAFQLISEGYGGWGNACLDSFVTSLIEISNAQLDILAEELKRICQEESRDGNSNMINNWNVRTHLKQYVKQHLAIIKLVELTERVFTVGLTAQFLAIVIGICTTLFQFLWVPLSWEFVLLSTYTLAVVVELLMFCWYGNQLIEKSLTVGDACYMSKWYNGDKQVGKYLFIIMERSKRPLRITTMQFSTLSLTLFVSILQWCYSLLTLLLKMYKKKDIEN